jgi:hypothetical protein
MQDPSDQKFPEETMSPAEILAELKRMAGQTEQCTDLTVLKATFYRVEALARQHGEDAEVQRAAAVTKELVIARARQAQRPTGEQPVPTPPEMRVTDTPPPPPSPLPAPLPTAPAAPAAAAPLRWKLALVYGAGIAVILFAGLLGLDRFIRNRRSAAPASSPTSTAPLAEPVLTGVALLTDLRTGSVLLDEKPAGDLQDGQLVLEKIPVGTHTVKISGKTGEAAFQFRVIPGVLPAVDGPVTTRNLLAVLVASSESAVRVYSSTPTKLAVDGSPAGEIVPGGTDLKSFSVGDHEISLGEGKDVRKVVFHATAVPTLTAFLKLDLNAGTLLVVAGEDDVKVILSGQEYWRRTKDRQLRIPFLPAGTYAVRVSKAGYENPPQQNAQIRKGEETRVAFTLRPIPVFAALRIRDGLPGTAVFLDQEKLGSVGDDRTFSAGSIKPGDHTLELRRNGHAPRRIQKQFRAGETVLLAGSELGLERLPGTLRLNVAPADSHLSIRYPNESQTRPIHEQVLSLPEGSYTVSASAPGFTGRSATVQVMAGESVTADVRLTREKAGRVASQTLGMADWEEPAAWVREGQYFARKGGNVVLFRATPVSGVLTFMVAPLKGKRLQWVLNYVDQKNYALFQIDKKNFYRKDVVNGKTFDLSKIPHNLGDEGPYNFQIDIAAGALVHRAQSGGRSVVLDNWAQPARNFTYGKFGFLIQGNDKIGLANFGFTPR